MSTIILSNLIPGTLHEKTMVFMIIISVVVDIKICSLINIPPTSKGQNHRRAHTYLTGIYISTEKKNILKRCDF